MDIPWQADLCDMMCWRVGQQRAKSDQIDSVTTQKNYPKISAIQTRIVDFCVITQRQFVVKLQPILGSSQKMVLNII